VVRKPTLLAQMIADKLDQFTPEEVDLILVARDKIVGERSSYNRGMSDTQPNWGRRG